MAQTDSVISIKPNKKSINFANRVPPEILEHPKMKATLLSLPSNYNFELPKTIMRIMAKNKKKVALQFPEGLLMFSLRIADAIEAMTNAEAVIMGDVTYGACCVDDYSARALNCDLLVHYGHSCLIPVSEMQGLDMLYVFVDIKIDALHFMKVIKANFSESQEIALVSTIQFLSTLHFVTRELSKEGYSITNPQSKPLSPGEILGCTAPKLSTTEILIYLGDGRFHLEAMMMSNPTITAYRYDPYTKVFTKESYDFCLMKINRNQAISKACSARTWGLILGTLGRQGNPRVLTLLKDRIEQSDRKCIVFLLSEIYPSKLDLIPSIEAWVQVACPRLSIDWGCSFTKCLLNSYEAAAALGMTTDLLLRYPMDYYAYNDHGPWTSNYISEETKSVKAKKTIKA